MNTNRRLWAAAGATLALAASPALAQPGDVFVSASPLPMQAPQFDKITDADFQPALEEAMKRQRSEIDAIANDPAAPTFANTFVAMEKSGRMLDRVTAVFFALAQANTDDALQKVQAEEAPRFSAHRDAIHLDPKLFARVKAVYDRRDSLGLDPEALQLVKVTYDEFLHAGAQLSPANQTRLKAVNEQLSTLSTSFNQKLLAATKAGAAAASPREALVSAYADEPFIHVLPEGHWPSTAAVMGSNAVHLQAVADPHSGRAVVIAALDNLVKGAAGQAVQIANLMLGLPEAAGLTIHGVAP